MCLAIPAQVVSVDDQLAVVEIQGVRRQASLMLLPEAKVGDFVLVHAGFAMQVVDQQEAETTNALLDAMHGAARRVE